MQNQMTEKCWSNIINIQNIYITELVTGDVLHVCKTLEQQSWLLNLVHASFQNPEDFS